MNHPIIYLAEVAAITGALALSQTTITNEDLLTAIERIGLAAVLVLFFVWTSWKRECRMSERIDFLDEHLIEIGDELSKLTEKVADAMDYDARAIDKAMEVLSARPCFAFPNRDEYEQWREFRKKKANGPANGREETKDS